MKDEKQFDINRETGKISALSSVEIEIDSSDYSRIIEQGKFTYSPFDKAFEWQTKTIEVKKKNK